MKHYHFSFKLKFGTFMPRTQPIQAGSPKEAAEKAKLWYSTNTEYTHFKENDALDILVVADEWPTNGHAFDFKTLQEITK